MDVIDNLISLSGVVHRIERRGIFTNNIYRRFEYPIVNDIDKSGTSPSGIFIFLIVHGKLYLVTVSQSQLRLERIGDDSLLFIDATFNNEESLFITLANDSCFHIFELYPPLKVCTKFADLPTPPISFQYYQLQNVLKVTVENDENFLFKFPDLFDPEDPAELPFIKNMVQDENGIFIKLFEEEGEEAIIENYTKENLTAEDDIDGIYEERPSLRDFAFKTFERGKYLQGRQRSLKERYQNILDGIENFKSKSFDINGRLRDAKKKMIDQIKKIYDILDIADEYAGLISTEAERLEDIKSDIEKILCDDDLINDEQESEFQEFFFFERLENIERKLFDNEDDGL